MASSVVPLSFEGQLGKQTQPKKAITLFSRLVKKHQHFYFLVEYKFNLHIEFHFLFLLNYFRHEKYYNDLFLVKEYLC